MEFLCAWFNLFDFDYLAECGSQEQAVSLLGVHCSVECLPSACAEGGVWLLREAEPGIDEGISVVVKV
jgi:hypothetical protein